MTRAERAAEKVQKAKAKGAELERQLKERIAEQQAETRRAEAALREETRKADNKRRYQWGAIAQEAGLFAWSTADFQAVCVVLARFKDAPQPAAVLEGLLGEELEAFAPASDDLGARSSYQRFPSPSPFMDDWQQTHCLEVSGVETEALPVPDAE